MSRLGGVSWLGLVPAAWTIVVVALATYAALLFAWLLALPTVRGAAMREALLLLPTAAAAATEADASFTRTRWQRSRRPCCCRRAPTRRSVPPLPLVAGFMAARRRRLRGFIMA